MAQEVYEPLTLPELFEPSPYGLASAVTWVTGSPHWQGGVQYDSDCTEVSVTVSPCISGAPEVIASKAATWTHVTRGSRPFTVYAEVDCSPGGSDFWETAQADALRALSNSGPTQMERTFWSGTSGNPPVLVYPNLTTTGPIRDSTNRIVLQPSSTIISGTPLDIVEGLGRLEEALGNCLDGLGVIHVPKRLGSALSAKSLVYEKGGKLYTYCGNQVAIGAGYDATIGPGATTPPDGSAWLIGTGPVFGIKATPRVFDRVGSFDRATNTLKMIAEQTMLLGWQCCLVAVLVTTGGEQAGDPNNPLQDT